MHVTLITGSSVMLGRNAGEARNSDLMRKPESAASERQRQCNRRTRGSGVHNRTVQFRVLGYSRQMKDALVSAVDTAHATRWREWQVKNEAGQRAGARHAHLVFTLIFIALGLWFGLQFLS